MNASNGVPLDVALAGFPFEEQVVSRATRFQYAPDVSLVTASAEDLIVLKSFAGRDQDWSDVRGILVRRPNELDWAYISQELNGLCQLDGGAEPIDRLMRLRSELDTGRSETAV